MQACAVFAKINAAGLWIDRQRCIFEWPATRKISWNPISASHVILDGIGMSMPLDRRSNRDNEQENECQAMPNHCAFPIEPLALIAAPNVWGLLVQFPKIGFARWAVFLLRG